MIGEYYKGIAITEKGSKEPVNYVGVHPFAWTEHPDIPEMGFTEVEVYPKEFVMWLFNHYTFLKSTKDFVINYPYSRNNSNKQEDYKHFTIEELYEHYVDINNNPFQNDIIDAYDERWLFI